MTDYDASELLEEVEGGGGGPAWKPEVVLVPLAATLSLLSCGVVATVMLASDLRKASWSQFVLLWAVAQSLLQLASIVEVIVLQVSSGEDAVTAGCAVYFFTHHSMSFLSTTAVMTLSLDRLLSRAKPSLYVQCGRRYVGVVLLLTALVLYSPVLTLNGDYYHHKDFMCVLRGMQSEAYRLLLFVYFYVTVVTVDLLGPLVVCVGVVGFWWLERKQRSSEDVRLLAPFLLVFYLLSLPSTVFCILLQIVMYNPMALWFIETLVDILHGFVRACFLIQPLVLLGCLTTSSVFRRAVKSVFLPRPYLSGHYNRAFMTEMTQVEEET